MSVTRVISRFPRTSRALALVLPLALIGATRVPWTELVESDWLYSLATRFATVDGHRVHYPTPPAELAKLLEARKEAAALRHLADARLELGDRPGALAAMEKWAEAEGPAAFDETARWAAAHQEWPLAFKAAERALAGLPEGDKRPLADLRITWAEQNPDQADALALRKARAGLFPQDPVALEDWLRALEKADRLEEADKALAATQALGAERRLLLRSDLQADHGNHAEAYRILDAALDQSGSIALRQAYAKRVDKAVPGAPSTWRATLDRTFDGPALLRLATYFQGHQRGTAAGELLRQIERRFETKLGRADHLLIARLNREIDALPEAFRATLAAAHLGTPEEQIGDLAALAQLALQAGGRPLALGVYNDEPYHWAARVDRTPGFWTGNVSFLLTGLPWKDSLERLETDSLPDRTFATARALADELAKRAPQHADLFALRVAIMERHVERGEGQAALALLPQMAAAGPEVLDKARRVALLAMRQVEVPLAEELRLMQARLRHLAADDSQPRLSDSEHDSYEDEGEYTSQDQRPWARIPRETRSQDYGRVLEESISRLEGRDRTHVSSLGLILAELDRLPNAEELWLNLGSRLEGWNLDDELGPRYERALERFKGPGIWSGLTRWHAKRSHHGDLKRLAEAIAQRFRASEIFSRTEGTGSIRVEIPEQPQILGRIRLVPWADWVRFKALERFPHSPAVFNAARHLVTTSQWNATFKPEHYKDTNSGPVVVPDQLMQERGWALFFLDAGMRENYLGQAMRSGTLEPTLLALEKRGNRTPVDDLLLFEGWSRLSRFEQAFEAADRLQASYPGDGPLAQRVLSLHRSLSGLAPGTHAPLARLLVERTAPALEDASALWTDLGELEEDRGRPEAAKAYWKNLLARNPRDAGRISELATLLWDYNHDAEALAVVEEGRKRLGQPRFFAFETGVLRENLKDLEGAVREYLDALRPEDNSDFGSAYDQDQRSLRRLAQLMARDRVYRLVERRIQGLRPGTREDERALAALFPLATLELPTPPQLGEDDNWIDQQDQPNDPTGRAQRAETREKVRPKEYDAITRIGSVLLAKTSEMMPKATVPEFLDAADPWSQPLAQKRWKAEQVIALRNTAMARRAELTPNEEERIRQEMARATFLANNGLVNQADGVWAALSSRISTLPEGATKLRAEAARAGYLERAKGPAEAAAEWQRLTTRHPWSLGLLEDRIAFLNRTNRGAEARTLLEEVIARAAAGHRETFLERLTTESLAASDLPRARRAVAKLLAETTLSTSQRLGALHLHARLSLRENAAWDAQATAKTEAAKLPSEDHGNLYYQRARAADLESAHGLALGLWIEALNRKTEREWLQAACRSAQKGGKAAELLGFFEKQKQRSPRDVRWAVAVRDIKRDLHQVEGAIEAARSAVAVRPEREDLWREAVELMVRGDRGQEAADFLEGWNRPRPADEGVARWRSELYARAGNSERALAIEKAALEAYQKEAPKENSQLDERRAQAAERLLALGLPHHALRIYSDKGDISACAGTRLSKNTQATLALLTGQFPRLLANQASGEFLGTAANALLRHGRPEQREEVTNFVLARIQTKGAPSNSGLSTWWPFVQSAGLEPQIRMALAQNHLATRPGPWQQQPPLAFVERVGADLVKRESGAQTQRWFVFTQPDLPKLWMKDLARRDRPEELAAFIEPRWKELIAEVHKPATGAEKRLPWAAWLDDVDVLETWARGAAKRPEKAQELAPILSDRKLWDRFWVLAARHWRSHPLVNLLPESSRIAWYRMWETTPHSQGPADPVLLARRKVVERATLAVANLITGQPQAADDPLILKLRGPQTVGEVLGKSGAWLWPEFAPRRDAKGQILETGDDRVIGSGVDEGRLPGALWGERPGEAWYVLETLARYRKGDATAPLVPLDVPARSGETDRTLLALRLAKGLKDLPLALELEAARPGALGDRRRLEARISLLMAAEKKAEAVESLRAFLAHVQPKLNETEYRWASGLTEEHGLPPVMELLDPETPVGPAFLAYLVDRRKEAADRFRTADPVGFRAALAARWARRERQLSPEQIRYWLRELWVKDSAPLPTRGLTKLGGLWRHAAPWMKQQPLQERAEILQMLEEVGQRSVAKPALFARLAKDRSDMAALLAVRGRLLRNEPEPALTQVDAMLAELRQAKALSLGQESYEASAAESTASASYEEGEEDAPEAQEQEQAQPSAPVNSEALVDRLILWLAPFQEHKQAQQVEERFRKLLKERRDEGSISTEAWRLAFRLAPTAELPALATDLDAAWFRGEVTPQQLGALCQILAEVLPSEAPRWLARWPQAWHFDHTRERAAIMVALKQPEGAARLLFEARGRSPWEAPQEVQAFDLWRRLGAPALTEAQLPTPWREALPFWTAKPEGVIPALNERLKAHPLDVLSARVALRLATPADEQALFRATAALDSEDENSGDQTLLKLRTARALLPTSWRAASRALGDHSPESIAQLLVKRRMRTQDINACLGDLARLARQADNPAHLQSALALLESRKAPNLKTLRVELGRETGTPQLTYRLVDGRPTSIGPRDLTWALLAQILKTEGVK